jgi:hypothetical protein
MLAGPSCFTCPLSGHTMADPVIAADGVRLPPAPCPSPETLQPCPASFTAYDAVLTTAG